MGRKKGEGSWGKKVVKGIEYIRFVKTYDGVKKEFTGRTVKEVKDKVKKFEDSNMFIQPKDVRKITFGEYITSWVCNVRVKVLEPSTILTNKTSINNHIKKHKLYTTQMCNLSSDLFQSFVDFMSQNFAKTTVDRAVCLINTCLKYALKRNEIPYNYLDDVVRVSECNMPNKKREVLWLEDEDVKKLIKEADRLNTKEFKITGEVGTRVYGVNAYYIILILHTGIRCGELMSLSWDDINFIKKEMTIHSSLGRKEGGERYVKDAKTESGFRTIPLSDLAIYSLKRISEINQNPQKVVTNVVNEKSIAATLHRMLSRAGCDVQKCGLHALRHTYGSLLLEKGVDIKTISYLMGHKSVQTTLNIYMHVTKKMSANAVDVLNKLNNVEAKNE